MTSRDCTSKNGVEFKNLEVRAKTYPSTRPTEITIMVFAGINSMFFPRKEACKCPANSLGKDDGAFLVLFCYSLKDSASERRTALEAAAKARGGLAVLSRLEFLKQAWSGTEKFLESIDDDIVFVKSLVCVSDTSANEGL